MRLISLPWMAPACISAIFFLPMPVLAATASSDLQGARDNCRELGALASGDVTVDSAQVVPPGQFHGRGNESDINLPGYCRLRATIKATSSSNIKVEMWLPDNWNHRFLGTGNGGIGGEMDYEALADGLRRGFAVANTDLGTSDGLAGMIGRMETVVDFGHRATHRMTTLGKAAISRYYGMAPKFSYFRGCSTGGGQGMHEAQRYPSDYDGVLAGAPGAGRVPAHLAFQWAFDVLHRDTTSYLTLAKRDLWAKTVMSACDKLDGVKDGLISRPDLCAIDPSVIECISADGPDCLTKAQVRALRKIYEGPRDPRTGVQLAPGYLKGVESELFLGAPPPRAEPPLPFPFLWVWGMRWDWRSFNWGSDVEAMHNTLDWAVDATSTDLSEFGQHGGKLLLYQGLADPIQVPGAAIDYMKRLGQARPEVAAQNTALFLVPGMSHCAGGYGPNVFGNVHARFVPQYSQDPRHDALAALQQWVEAGRKPEDLVATEFEQTVPAKVKRTGLLCAWPKVALLKTGHSNIADAKSFECRAAL